MNRRNFIAGLGAVAAVPILPELTPAAPINAPNISWIIGFYEAEFWTCRFYKCERSVGKFDILIQARQFNNEPDCRVVSAVCRPSVGNKRKIEITYLEPVAGKYPENEDDE